MPKRRLAPTIALLAAAAAAQGAASDVFDLDGRLGGPATVRDASLHAFGFPAPVLDRAERRAFAVGNSFFRRNWTSPPGAETGRQGLGPLFNARSCSACHLRDGRSRPPDDDDVERSGLLLRIGVRDAAGGPDAPHPLYGVQLQDLAAPGLAPEGRAEIAVENRPG
ncbi:MAG TPA: di-heme oxidoredictase family protein, partial [Planctomycetota bacterium]|nr:di-heme oxidoredictase family protein [Planctomycetota bacterium]